MYNMMILAIGRSVHILLTFLTIKIATTFLLPSEMAKVYLISSVVAFFSSVFVSPVGLFINRKINIWNSDARIRQYFNLFFVYLLLCSVFSALMSNVAISIQLINIHTDKLIGLVIILLSFVALNFNSTCIPSLNIIGFQVPFLVLSVLTSLSSLVLAITFTNLNHAKTSEVWMSGIICGQLLIGIIGLKILYGKIPQKVQRTVSVALTFEHYKNLFHFAWPVSLGAFLSWLQTQSYRFISESAIGLHDLGIFAAGYAIGSGIMAGIESILTSYFQPKLYKDIGVTQSEHQVSAFSQYINALLPTYFLVGFTLSSMAPELSVLFLGPMYRESANFLLFGIFAEVCRVTASVFAMGAHIRMKTRPLLIPTIAGTVTLLILLTYLTPLLKSHGIGYALVIAGIVSMVSTYLVIRHAILMRISYSLLFFSVLYGLLIVILQYLWYDFFQINDYKNIYLTIGFSLILYFPIQFLILKSHISN
ncbi:MAG: hypothetical protein HQL98_12635 [Magnetococcales bacterium]|nr:hypothetical protein [Magnetococcales bacterium]